MDEDDGLSREVCGFCGKAYKLPVEEGEDNLPRLLLCSHVYCSGCLQTIECDGVIKCPECEVESTLPEEGVCGLQEDSRIIGLIYTAKMKKGRSRRSEKSRHRCRNKLQVFSEKDCSSAEVQKPVDAEKFEKSLDEALAQAAENLAQLEFVSKSLISGLSQKVGRERARLEVEIMQASNRAVQAVQKWKDAQLGQLSGSSMSQAAVSQVREVNEKIKALEVAMRMAREVRRVPSLEQYCALDKVLQTLQAPVDIQSFHVDSVEIDSDLSCVFKSEVFKQSLTLCLKMEVGRSKHLSESPVEHPQKSVERRSIGCVKPSENRLPSPQRRLNLGAKTFSPRDFSAIPRKFKGLPQKWASDHGGPDIIIEEILDDGPENALPPTGPEMANDNWRIHNRGRKQSSGWKRNVTQWVVVTHVVTPSHFYVQYVAEKKESEILSRRINQICSQDGCHFAPSDTLQTGSTVFVKWQDGAWRRAHVVEMLQNGSEAAVNTCEVTQLAGVRVFFLDYGLTESVTITSEEGAVESPLTVVNNRLRKVADSVAVELGHFTPQAVRCSLKDLVPYNLTTGWSKEAQVEFCSVVGSAAVEMRPLGEDRDCLLVDLRKAPMDQSSDIPFSVREYLVFIEVARFYSPVKLEGRPLLYYPPVYPKIDTEHNAVVSHINSPADFYIQLVDNMESLLLCTKLQECYGAAEEELNIFCPVIGQACVARFNDQMWYRAQVTGQPGGRNVEVRYVDFGNKKVLPVSDLRKIKDEFFALPSMAIHCSLSDVVPVQESGWSEACTNTFIDLAHQKLVTVVATEVPKTEPLPVKLFEGGLNETPTSISDLLVKENLARFKDNDSQTTMPEDSAVWEPPLELHSAVDKTNVQDVAIPGNPEFDPQLKFPTQLKDLKVRVTHVNSPSSFYVHLTLNDRQLRRISKSLKQECEQTEPQDVVWKADSYCAAHTNGVWERGRICGDVTQDDIAEVRLCDCGSTVKLHVSDLRPLSPSLIGSLALECTLNDIRPAGGRTSWTDTACDLFSFYVIGASAVLTIKESTDERPLPVTLLCADRKGQFISVSDFLISEGLALRQREPSRDAVSQQHQKTEAGDVEKNGPMSASPAQTGPKPAPRLLLPKAKVETSSYLPPELPCLGVTKMTVTSVGDDGVIYVRSQSAERQLEQLNERIQQSMKTLPRQKPYTWRSVLGCAVIGPDMLWYRGQILEILGGHVKVHYVDFGKVEIIPVVHVHPVLLCDNIPQLCLPCKLLSVIPVGGKWQRDAVVLLREALVKRSVDLLVVELPADLKDSLTVEIFVDGLSLSEILCQHEHASMDCSVSSAKSLSVKSAARVLDVWDISTEGLLDSEEVQLGPFMEPQLPEEGERFQIRVKHLQTPNEVFLWPVEETADMEVGDNLVEALQRINANINNLPRLTSFPFDGPCLAEYSDGKYYRAKLMKITGVEPVSVLVQHVDFGSHDSLPTSKLRQMPAELLEFPSRALKVRVGGFKASAVRRDEDVLPYSPDWSVKAVMEMIDLLHNNITASVVAREPELTVLLYNEDGQPVHLPLVSSGLAELE